MGDVCLCAHHPVLGSVSTNVPAQVMQGFDVN
jgi:hypothetical protein